jgi:hypothetical protein
LPFINENLAQHSAPDDCYIDLAKCWYAKGDGPCAAIVLEDLSRSGYKISNRYEGLTEVETRTALRAFARFHANSIEAAQKLGEDRQTKFPQFEHDSYREENVVASFGKDMFYSMEQALRKMPNQTSNADRFKSYIDSVPCLFARVAELSKKPCKLNGFLLGDCWLNNMMFK